MATSEPSVTVVVPVRNGAREIGRLLDSLLAQDYPRDRLQLIVVDNGSTDGTRAVVAHRPVTLLSEPSVLSSYAARNRGAAAARGDWVAFTDADCVAAPDWLTRLLAPGIEEDVGAVVGEVVALESHTAVQRLTERFGLMRHAVTLPHKALPCFSTANVAVRRDLLSNLGGFREDVRFFGDMELSWRLQLTGRRRLLFRPEARILHRHRRTLGALWRQGVQHGRGVAFMKEVYPREYRIHPGEQLKRLGGIAQAAGRTLGTEAALADRLIAPIFLSVWYGGMLAGYLRGPART